MGVSNARKLHELERRREKLRLRAALARGEEQARLFGEIEAVSAQIDKIRESRFRADLMKILIKYLETRTEDGNDAK